MEIQMLDRWIVLRVRFINEALWIAYEDDAGTRRDPPRNVAGGATAWQTFSTALLDPHLWPLGLWPPGMPQPQIHTPADLEGLLAAVISSFPAQRLGPHANGPVPAPIFVDAPPEMPDLPWAAIVEQLPPIQAQRAQVQTVNLTGKRWSTRPPFRLPLRALAVGARCDDALTAIKSASWYVNDPTAQTHGLRFETIESGGGAKAMRTETRDIVVVEAHEAEDLLRAAARLSHPAVTRPRLVIVLSDSDRRPFPPHLAIPPGMSLLWIRTAVGESAPGFIKEFFYGVIHNYPLHEALKAATRAVSQPSAHDLFLFADPRSNYDLRLSDALTQLHREALALSQTVAGGDLDAFFERLGEDAPAALRSAVTEALEEGKPIKPAVSEMISWAQETEGLVPLAYTEAALTMAKEAEQKVRTMLAPVLSNKAFVEAVKKRQERRVDVALEFFDQNRMIYSPVGSAWKLVKGARYRLRVHIGRPADNSLMVGEPPSLDPLLPEPEGEQGHQLEVVVFEKDFTLLSPRVQSLQLPPLRGSQPVYFELKAPQLETAELRIGIYHRNHLLQSFILEARLSEREWEVGQEKGVTVRLNFSRTARFANLDQLAPRALSIGVNQNRDETAHTFMLKRNDEAEPLDLTEAIVSDQQKTFREMLQKATVDSTKRPRFATFPKPGEAPSVEFEEEIRKLADFGRGLYRAIFIRSGKKMQKELRAIAASADDTIQIVRLHPNFAFPWPALYDFQLPQKIAGAPPAPVCLGVDGAAASAAGPTKLCSHGPNDKVYCIYGFWGLRHRVEQLMALGDSLEDAVDKVEPNPQSGICLAVGENDEHTNEMTSELHTKLGAAVFELAPGDDLLDVLWETPKRPAILVTLGHLQTTDIDGELPVTRIVLQPNKKWLQAELLTDRQISDGDWEQPRTLVLLMACGAAATDIRTLNDLVMAFTSVRAAAIAGTECVVFTALAARFTKEITLDLWGGKPLGEAVMNFNRRLVSSGNPLAFVFNYLGDADLKIATQSGG